MSLKWLPFLPLWLLVMGSVNLVAGDPREGKIIISKPVILKGDNITLSCTLDKRHSCFGGDYRSCTWTKDGIVIRSSANKKMDSYNDDIYRQCNLNLMYVNESNEGVYTCCFTYNPSCSYYDLKFDQSVILRFLTVETYVEYEEKVVNGLEFIEEPLSRNVENSIQGTGGATFRCSAKCPNGQCSWFKDGDKVTNTERYGMKVTHDGLAFVKSNTICTLNIEEVLPEDAGKWHCEIEDCIHSVLDRKFTLRSKEAFLNFNMRQGWSSNDRKLITGPSEAAFQVKTGNDVTLDCVFSREAPSCIWTKDDRLVQMGGRYRMRKTKPENCTLEISQVQLLDAGNWRCVYPEVEPEPIVASEYAKIDVLVSPDVPEIVVDGVPVRDHFRYVFANKLNTSITCWSINGNPPAKLKWTVGNRPLLSSTTNYVPSVFHKDLTNSYSYLNLNEAVFHKSFHVYLVMCVAEQNGHNVGQNGIYIVFA